MESVYEKITYFERLCIRWGTACTKITTKETGRSKEISELGCSSDTRWWDKHHYIYKQRTAIQFATSLSPAVCWLKTLTIWGCLRSGHDGHQADDDQTKNGIHGAAANTIMTICSMLPQNVSSAQIRLKKTQISSFSCYFLLFGNVRPNILKSFSSVSWYPLWCYIDVLFGRTRDVIRGVALRVVHLRFISHQRDTINWVLNRYHTYMSKFNRCVRHRPDDTQISVYIYIFKETFNYHIYLFNRKCKFKTAFAYY